MHATLTNQVFFAIHRFSHFFHGLLVTSLSISNAIMMPPSITYQPSGSVLGDFTSPQDYHPKVVLNLLADCANVTVDTDSCLVSTFADLRVQTDLNDMFACESCYAPPNVNASTIMASAMDAQAACALSEPTNTMDVTELVDAYETVVEYGCWVLLRDEQSALFLEAKWINSCADISLPFPQPDIDSESSPFLKNIIHHKSVLTCMLDRVFDTSPMEFGLEDVQEGSPESCYPPGYDNITAVCASILGPKVFNMCNSPSPKEEDPYGYPMEYEMSMDYEMSMNYNPSEQDVFVFEFCYVLENLSSEVGRNCLLDICDFEPPTPSPSRSPSASRSPSDTPSSSPTKTASVTPSGSPSESPSESSSASPSVVPSPAPSSSPSLSQFPTTSTVEFNVIVAFFWALRLNVTSDDLLPDTDSFIEALEASIENLVDGPSNATVRFATNSSGSIEDFSDFEVEVSASRMCNIGDCDLLGNLVLTEVQQYLDVAAMNGDLADGINRVVQEQNLTVAPVMVVDYQLLNETFSVVDVEDGASSAIHLSHWFGLLATLASLVLV